MRRRQNIVTKLIISKVGKSCRQILKSGWCMAFMQNACLIQYFISVLACSCKIVALWTFLHVSANWSKIQYQLSSWHVTMLIWYTNCLDFFPSVSSLTAFDVNNSLILGFNFLWIVVNIGVCHHNIPMLWPILNRLLPEIKFLYPIWFFGGISLFRWYLYKPLLNDTSVFPVKRNTCIHYDHTFNIWMFKSSHCFYRWISH